MASKFTNIIFTVGTVLMVFSAFGYFETIFPDPNQVIRTATITRVDHVVDHLTCYALIRFIRPYPCIRESYIPTYTYAENGKSNSYVDAYGGTLDTYDEREANTSNTSAFGGTLKDPYIVGQQVQIRYNKDTPWEVTLQETPSYNKIALINMGLGIILFLFALLRSRNRKVST